MKHRGSAIDRSLTIVVAAMCGRPALAAFTPIVPGPAFTGGANGSGGVQATNLVKPPTTSGPNVTSLGSAAADLFQGTIYYLSSTQGNSPVGDTRGPTGYLVKSSGTVTQLSALVPNTVQLVGTAVAPPYPGTTTPYAVNAAAGVAVGSAAEIYSSSGNSVTSTRAVSWNYATGAVTALPSYANSSFVVNNNTSSPISVSSVNSTGISTGLAYTLNAGGTIAGTMTLYTSGTTTSLGTRAVRWDSTSSTPTVLAVATMPTTGQQNSTPIAINGGGTIAGSQGYYVGGVADGTRASVWAAGAAAATTTTLLPSLSTTTAVAFSSFNDVARTINDSGVVAGLSTGTAAGQNGTFAMRWTPNGVGGYTYEQLQTVGVSSTGSVASGDSAAINSTGDVVGRVTVYATAAGIAPGGGTITANQSLGIRPMLWKSGTTTPTQLGVDGVSSSGVSNGFAYGVNDSDQVVGSVDHYDANGNAVSVGGKTTVAALWDGAGNFTDLNTLIDPSLGWVNLYEADGITSDGWVSGLGIFDPDGSGPLPSYQRAFLLEVPEPSGLAVLAVSGVFASRRRRLNLDTAAL